MIHKLKQNVECGRKYIEIPECFFFLVTPRHFTKTHFPINYELTLELVEPTVIYYSLNERNRLIINYNTTFGLQYHSFSLDAKVHHILWTQINSYANADKHYCKVLILVLVVHIYSTYSQDLFLHLSSWKRNYFFNLYICILYVIF